MILDENGFQNHNNSNGIKNYSNNNWSNKFQSEKLNIFTKGIYALMLRTQQI